LIGGFDLNELAPSNTPFGITDGEGNPCYDTTPGAITTDLGNCVESAEDEARRPFPTGSATSWRAMETSATVARMLSRLKLTAGLLVV
jgi:hypothetical protein